MKALRKGVNGAGIRIGFDESESLASCNNLPDEIPVNLTINFTPEKVSIQQINGEFEFRLKNVMLNLKVSNARFTLNDKFPSDFKIKEANRIMQIGQIQIYGFGKEISYIKYQLPFLTTCDDEFEPYWIMRASDKYGSLSNITASITEKAGLLRINDQNLPCSVEVSAKVEGSKDFFCTQMQAIAKNGFSNNFIRILGAFLCRKYLFSDAFTLCHLKMEIDCAGNAKFFLTPGRHLPKKLSGKIEAKIKQASELENQDTAFSRIVDIIGLDPDRDFINANLNGISFYGNETSKFNFTGSLLEGARFSGNLRGLKLNQTNLTNATFDDADMRGIDCFSSNLRNVRLARINADNTTRIMDSSGIDKDMVSYLESFGTIVKSTDMPPDAMEFIDTAITQERVLSTSEKYMIGKRLIDGGFTTRQEMEKRIAASVWPSCISGALIPEVTHTLNPIAPLDNKSIEVLRSGLNDLHRHIGYTLVSGSTDPINSFLTKPSSFACTSRLAKLFEGDCPAHYKACIDYAVNSRRNNSTNISQFK